ncbi:hypothetical protein C1645_794147 [Glomus cerebriforme]|uniref:Uncharacterized protein n=1 Tax=Glomus cerebriforme TaxID=658196 RepID=A0A397S6C9_9GLOM|nr:hypothetical protein C1645_794147 [Glomus cerebriforme]
MTQEVVYAIHPFRAVRDDELNFEYGEPIIILEKDDMFGDGWWKGKNIHGKIGLFPMNYTSYNKPRDRLDYKNLPNTPVVKRSESSKVIVDSKEINSIIDDTMEDLQNRLQIMINNNIQDSFNNNHQIPIKPHPRKPKLSTSSTSASSSYFSARINSEVNSPRNSLYQQQNHIPPINNNLIDENKPHPMTWDVQQVCLWLSENGFSSEQKKFIDNDVTGDVLLGLNLVTLKELDITSFGKRVHILNTIALLKDQFSIYDDDNNFDKSKILSSKIYSNSRSDLSKIDELRHSFSASDDSFSDSIKAFSDSQHTLIINKKQINDQKNIIDPASYYDVNPTPSEESEKPKIPKKSSRVFLKFGNFAKSNNTKSNKERKEKKSNKSRPLTGGWDFTMDEITKESERIKNENEKRSRNKPPSVYEEGTSTSEHEKYLSLRLIPRRRKKISLDRKGVVGNQLGLPKQLLDNEERAKKVNSYYSKHNVDYINENNEVLKKIGKPDHEGWLKKQGDKYKTFKNRYCILKGTNLYYLKSDKSLQKSRIKGQIDLNGYKIISDENVYQGKYGFKLVHDTERPYFFVHEDLETMRGWIKAIMKSTIERNITVPITSSSQIQTVPLSEASKVANRMLQPRPAPPPPNVLVVNSTFSNILPSTPTFSNLPPRPAPSPPILEHKNEKSTSTLPLSPLSPTFPNLPPRSASSPPNMSNNSTSSNILPLSPKFSNLPPRLAPSPPILDHKNEKSTSTPPNLLDNSTSSNTPPSSPTFSNISSRPTPSPPIFGHKNEKSTITIPLSSLPKPKAPPTGALPPRPKPSNLNLNSNSHKIIKSASPEQSSPSFALHKKYSASQLNSPTKIPKFPSMSISLPNAPRSPSFPPKNNEIPTGYYV